jgi:hypothetical protein
MASPLAPQPDEGPALRFTTFAAIVMTLLCFVYFSAQYLRHPLSPGQRPCAAEADRGTHCGDGGARG